MVQQHSRIKLRSRTIHDRAAGASIRNSALLVVLDEAKRVL